MSKGNSFEVYSEIDTPFVQIRKDVILELDIYDLAVYTHLMRYMNKASKKCHPSLNRLKEEIKIGKDRLIKSIKSLESKNLLRVEKATNTRNRYTFLQPNFASRLERPPIEVVGEIDQGSRLDRPEVVGEIDPNNNNRTIINNNNKIEKAKPSKQTEQEFGLEVASFMNQIEGFDQIEARKFFDHYSEPDKKGKMLKDKQKTWDTRRRINKWMDNARKWNQNTNSSNQSFREQDRQKADEEWQKVQAFRDSLKYNLIEG